jgi:hypothetical protein
MLLGIEIIVHWNARAPKHAVCDTSDGTIKRIEAILKKIKISAEDAKSAISEHLAGLHTKSTRERRETRLDKFLCDLSLSKSKPISIDDIRSNKRLEYQLNRAYAKIRSDIIRGARNSDEIEQRQMQATDIIERSKKDPEKIGRLLHDYINGNRFNYSLL